MVMKDTNELSMSHKYKSNKHNKRATNTRVLSAYHGSMRNQGVTLWMAHKININILTQMKKKDVDKDCQEF